MIGVIATGIKDGPLGAKREKLIEDAVEVCLNELNINKFRGIIHVKQTKSRKLLEGWAVGFCTMSKVDTNGGKYWWGVIELKNDAPKDLVKTICHEMVHIKQYLRKELGMDGVTWKGEDTTDVEYMDNPSEIEAYDLQEKLYARCVDLKVV